jgi:Flp pilus assembly protein TadD
MGRRRRKQERAEREIPRSLHHDQGELLAVDAGQLPAHDPDVEDDDVEEPGSDWTNGAPRDLVLFELVEELGAEESERADTPTKAPAPPAAAVERPLEPARARPDADQHALSFEEPGNPEQALERLESARLLTPDNVEVLVGLGLTLGLLGRYDEAERELRRALKLAPDQVAVRAGLGLLSFRRGLYQQAEVELRWVCEQDPQHGAAHFYRGEALNRLGKVDQALEVLERATRLQPTNHRAFYTMGILYDRKNLRDEAAAMYRKARELQRR